MCTVYRVLPVAVQMNDDPTEAPRRFGALTVTVRGGWTVETIRAGMGTGIYLARTRTPDGEVRHVIAGDNVHACTKAAAITAALELARAELQRREEDAHE